MIDRGNNSSGDALVETASKAIANWVNVYRNALGLCDEFGTCDPNDVVRMASEIGVTPGQIAALAARNADANLLKEMLTALKVDPKALSEMDPLMRRELQWLCLTCPDKERCRRELEQDTAAGHFHDFCPNAISLDEIVEAEDQSSSQ